MQYFLFFSYCTRLYSSIFLVLTFKESKLSHRSELICLGVSQCVLEGGSENTLSRPFFLMPMCVQLLVWLTFLDLAVNTS